jgi:uncharacterized membrane protein YjdF
MDGKRLSLLARAIYLCFLIDTAIRGDWGGLETGVIVFLVSGGFYLLGRKDEEFYRVDAAVIALFIISAIITRTIGWDNGIWAADKLLHLGAGIVLGWCAVIYYRPLLRQRVALMATAVLAALGVGAAWEVFEWALHLLPPPFTAGYSAYGLTDTMWDLVMDTLGAALIAILLTGKRRKKKKR